MTRTSCGSTLLQHETVFPKSGVVSVFSPVRAPLQGDIGDDAAQSGRQENRLRVGPAIGNHITDNRS